MHLGQLREGLEGPLSIFIPAPNSTMKVADAFLLTSCLQKSLRRADAAYAHGAAQTLLAIDPPRLWRRLMICAVEDFGLGDLCLTSQVIAAASDRAWRRRNGDDRHVLSFIVDRLLHSPRDRRTDEAYMLAVSLAQHRDPDTALMSLGASERLTELLRQAVALVLRCEQIVPYRGLRAVIASECDVAIARMAHQGRADRGLEEACIQARRTTQCLLPVLLPLLKVATEEAGGQMSIEKRLTPELRGIEGLPSYAIDGFTRPGRVALMTLARQDRRLATLLAPLPTAKGRLDALVNLLFVVEGGVCTTELSDPLYEELKTHSQGCWAGLPGPALAEGLAIMTDAIPALNEIRSNLWLED